MKCYLCCSSLVEKTVDELEQEKFGIYVCPDCSLVFMEPKADEDRSRFFYEKGSGVYSETNSGLKKLQDKLLELAGEQYELIRPLLNPGNICLEIGCTVGSLIDRIKGDVTRIAGYEINERYIEFCKNSGKEIVTDLAEGDIYGFDRIFISYFLEHSNDPKKLLKHAYNLLENDGFIFIFTPNIEDALISIYQLESFRKFYFSSMHNFYFSKHSLERILMQTGFHNVNIVGVQRYGLSNHLHWMMAGQSWGTNKLDDIFDGNPNDLYKNALKKYFKCDTLLGIAKK